MSFRPSVDSIELMIHMFSGCFKDPRKQEILRMLALLKRNHITTFNR